MTRRDAGFVTLEPYARAEDFAEAQCAWIARCNPIEALVAGRTRYRAEL